MDALPSPCDAARREFHAKDGRLELCLCLMPQGGDIHASLLGGEAHVGAVAVAAPGEATEVCQRPQHREGALAALVAGRLARALGCAVSVSCGIHFAGISRAEIAAVEKLAARLVEECILSLCARSNESC